MNKPIIIADFLKRLKFQIVPCSKQPNSQKHTALALVTRMPYNIPIGKQIYFQSMEIDSQTYILQFDVHPVLSVPGWFFVHRHIF